MQVETSVGERFEIRGVLGEGGLGTVYRAKDGSTGAEVALKVLRAGAAGEADVLRFKQEYRALARLRHPNLCAVHEFGLTPEGQPFFTMELVPGEDLQAAMPLPPDRLLAILPQLGRALAYLHDHGLVHGDVKPENVRVTPDGHVKLMDLGFVQPAGHVARAPVGTLSYMAPEIVRGDRVDARADLYALGAMCHHLLTGRPPFVGASPRDVLRAHLTRRARPLRELDATLPAYLEKFVAKLMAREPVGRYASVGEALAALGLTIDQAGGPTLLAGAFVGRAAHLAAFQDALRTLQREARGQVLWLTGPPGCGRSRLLDELRVLAQLDDVPFLASSRRDMGRPYGAFVGILRGILAKKRGALDGASPEQRAALGRLAPDLAGGPETAALEPREERALIQAAIAHAIRAAAGPGGAVIGLDDWDRADVASVETLAYLRRNAQGVPFLIVGTTRELEPKDGQALPVPPLSADETAALAASMLGSGELPGDAAAAIYRWTSGHAGHVPRVVEHLVRTGALRRAGGRWVAAEGLAAGELGADLRELALAPYHALTPAAARLADLVAVIGARVDLGALADLIGTDEEGLFAALDEARASHVLTIRDGRVALATGGLEAAIYEVIPEKRRISLHAAIAARLEARLGEGKQAHVGARTDLARHLLRSRQVAKALPVALHAADLNMAISAIDTARGLLRDGLALTAAAPERYERWRRDYLIRLAGVERWRGDVEAMSAALDEALPLAERLGEPEPLARLLLHKAANHTQRMKHGDLEAAIAALRRAAELVPTDMGLLARGRFYLGQAHFFLGQPADAGDAFLEAARAAETASLPFWRAKALAFLGYLQATGAPAGREEGLRRMGVAAAIQGGLGDTYGQGFTSTLQGDALLQLFRLREAEAAFRSQVAVNQELGVGEDHVTGLANLACVLAWAGRPAEALEACDVALPLATQLGHPVGALARAVSAYARAGLGDLGRAEAELRAAEAAGRAAGDYMFSHAIAFLVEGWLRLGRADEARRLAQAGLDLLEAQPNPVLRAQLQALLGEAHARLGAAEPARELAAGAAEAAEAGDHAFARILTLRLRARLALRTDRADEALRLAGEALALAEAAGSPGFVAELAALLGEVSLRMGGAEALTRFRAVQAYADREDAPFLRAVALHGQAEAEPASERSEPMVLEAQQILGSLADTLDAQGRTAFLERPEVARVLEARPRAPEPLSIESGPLVFDRIKAVSEDLLGFATQYGTLFKEWVASTRQLEMLNALARRINESLDLEDVLHQAVALTLEITKAERAFVFLVDEEAPQRLVCRAAIDHRGQAVADARVSMSVCRRVLATGEAVCVLDASEHAELAAQPSIADLDLRTLMCVPLAARGQSLGVLYVDSRAVVATFTRKDIELLRAIASHASVAIGNATLYSQSRQHSADLSKALDMYREAMRQANTDTLTGLNNRRCFEELAAREVDATRRYRRHLSVILMDVDHFKSFNDTYGHAVGDDVLKAMAQVLTASVRVCDVPARLGGEEFAVLCPETPPEGALIVAERIRRGAMAAKLVDQAGNPVRPVTVSLGIADYVPGDVSIADPLERADQALYACKRAGRNQHQVWRPGILQEGAAVPEGG